MSNENKNPDGFEELEQSANARTVGGKNIHNANQSQLDKYSLSGFANKKKGITSDQYFVGLVAISVLSLVMMNIFAIRPVGVGGGMRITEAGLVFVSVLMVVQNMIGEVWGNKTAIKVSIFAIVCQIIVVIMAQITIALPVPAGDDNVFLAENFAVMFDGNWRIVTGSIAAFVFASAFNIFIYDRIKKMFGSRKGGIKIIFAIGAIAATIIAQFADDFTFNIVAFAPTGGWLNPVYELPWKDIMVQIFTGIVSQILCEFIIIALIAAHFVKFLKRKKQEQDGIVDVATGQHKFGAI